MGRRADEEPLLRYLVWDDLKHRETLLDDDDRAILEALPRGRDADERRAAADPFGFAESIAEHPEQIVGRTGVGDEWFLEDPGRRRGFVECCREAVRQGVDAMAPQFVAHVAAWGFRLEDITMLVHVWAGANDAITPPAMMRRVVERIPQHTLTVWTDVGHAGIAKYMRDVLDEL